MSHNVHVCTVTVPIVDVVNNDDNNNDDLYSAVIVAEPLQEITRFT